MVKGKRHTLLVNLWFDKPVSRAEALAAAQNNIHGKFYATVEEEERDGWTRFRVQSVRRPRGEG